MSSIWGPNSGGNGGPGSSNPGVSNPGQTDWYISNATGSDSNDGSVLRPLKTLAEWTRRTVGISPTVSPTIHILDTDPTNGGPDLEIAYAEIPFGLRVLGTATTVPNSPTTITTWRSETFVGSGTARAITTTGANWPSLQNGTGQGPRIRCPAKNAVCWTAVAETTTQVRVSAPYASVGIPATFFAPSAPTELANGDTIVCESLPIIREIRIRGTIIPALSPNITGASLIIENLETEGGNQSFFGASQLEWQGAGTVFFVNCGVGNSYIVSNNVYYVGCRVDGVSPIAGNSFIYGCLLFWSYFQTGGLVTLGDVLSASVQIEVDGGQTKIQRNSAVFDVAIFTPNEGGFVARSNGAIYINAGLIYGSGNTYGIHCMGGGTVSIRGTFKSQIVGETANIKLDDALFTNAQVPAINAATGSKVVLLDTASSIVVGKSIALTTTGVFNWDVTGSLGGPTAHIIATGNCTVTPINAAEDCLRLSLEFIPTTAKTLTLSGVTFATASFTQAALTTLCGSATRIFIEFVNKRGVIYVENFVGYSA